MIDRDTLLAPAKGPYPLFATVASVGGTFVLILQGTNEAVSFDPAADLASVIALPRTQLMDPENGPRGLLVAVGRGSSLAVARNRFDPAAGNVPRTFLTLFTEAARRRATH